ncbi:MAG: TolC family protein [Planctomycetota bacterium]|jgi:NodT family efflux transporter outer membrane factor (OMF) lipoprotein|nr:TolC family protein [Planctomycetota bacterium]
MNKNLILSAFSMTVIVSCTNAPLSDAHQATFQGSEVVLNSKAHLDQWWREFENDELSNYVELVLEHNFDLAAAAENLKSVAETTEAIIGSHLPALNLSNSIGNSRTNMIGLPIPGAGDVIAIESDRAALDLNLSWELDFFGRIAAEEKSALSSLRASEANYVATQLAISGQAARTWTAYAFVMQQIQVINAVIGDQQKMLASLVDASELNSRSDLVIAAKSELIGLKNMLAQTKSQASELESALAILASNNSFLLLQSFEPPRLLSKSNIEVNAEAVSRRPDLIALEAELRVAAHQADLALAALYPSFSIGLAIGSSSDQLGAFLDGDYRTWSFGANVLAPLFNGGSLRKQHDAAVSRFNAASYSFGQHCIRAFSEISTLINNERFLSEQFENHQQIAELNQLQIDTKLQSMQYGNGRVQDVLANQIASKQNRLNQLSTNLLLVQNRIDLHLAIGGSLINNQ